MLIFVCLQKLEIVFVRLKVCKLHMFLANINWLRQQENCVAGLREASKKTYWHNYSSINDERENEILL